VRSSAASRPENHDLEQALAAKTPLVIGVVLDSASCSCLSRLQAQLIAAPGVLTNLLAISMDYTVFLLSLAKEHYDRTGDPREAAIGGLATPAASSSPPPP